MPPEVLFCNNTISFFVQVVSDTNHLKLHFCGENEYGKYA